MKENCISRTAAGALAFCILLLCTIGCIRTVGEKHSVLPPRDDGDRVANPKALRSGLLNMNAAELRRAFQDPPADYRSMPLWVWNDELEWPRLREQLHQYKEQGIGGVFVHPRPGLMTEYMGEQWLSLWQQALNEGKRLGMTVNIYDENSYPSGFTGGHVPSAAPDTGNQYVVPVELGANDRIKWNDAETVSVFAQKKDTNGAVASVRRFTASEKLQPGETPIVYVLRHARGNTWTAGFPYVDLTNPETARLFLETTFEKYRSRFGQGFGKTVRWAFDDEPLLATEGAYEQAREALPLSRYILAEFEARCGYDLAEHLPSLYSDTGEYTRVRFDYWQLLHDLWKENYMRPLFLWCDRHNIQFTGHWMEHEWPYPWISPADASLYAFEHVPGIDMLEGTRLRKEGSDPHMLFTIKQVASASHQLGRRAFCEAYGVAGWDSTFEHYKRFGDWLMVHGINFMDQHLSFSTIRGARKRDHPQSFSDVAAWWPYYRLHADHLARVCLMTSQGTTQNRVLVLEPTTSGFLQARRKGNCPELETLRRQYSGLVQSLADNQVDFDLGDEYMLQWFGSVPGKSMRIGKADYDLVVWPEGMTNLRKESLPVLEAYLKHGGIILALSEPARFVDGRESSQFRDLSVKFAAQWRSIESVKALPAEIVKLLPSRTRLTPAPANVAVQERLLKNGDRLCFFVNSGLTQACCVVALQQGGALERWDTVSGSISEGAFRRSPDGQMLFDLTLAPAGSALYLVKSAPRTPPVENRREPARKPLVAENWLISPDSPNVLVLDYCDLTLGGQNFADLNSWRANWRIWYKHGFERPAWDNAVQFRTRVFDRNHFGADSGFEAVFRFELDTLQCADSLELAVECPEVYQVELNGSALDFKGSQRWLDPHLRKVPIKGLVRAGTNEIRIKGRPFDVRMELENVYILGNFKLVPAERGFSIGEPGRLDFGSWTQQGWNFYGGAVLYETAIQLDGKKSNLRVSLPDWQGSLVEVMLDGKRATLLGWPPYETVLPGIAPGSHKLGLRVVSTPRNNFGPYHNPEKLRMRAWPAAWAEFPEHQPAGKQYDVVDYGLLGRPVLEWKTPVE